MAFNSIAFVAFFPIFLLIYWCLRGQARLLITLGGSYLFYGFWDYRFLGLILLSTIVDYTVAILLDRSDSSSANGRLTRRALLCTSLVVNLGILFAFKYFHFFADSLIAVAGSLGTQPDWTTLNIVLPVGISFYTFQTLSYTIDVYRGTARSEKNFWRFATFVAFFPQLVAGPIVRCNELLPQLARDATFSGDDLFCGLGRITQGFFKKLVIADSIAIVVDPMFDFPMGYGTLNSLLLVSLFSVQVYADFSGYSDIAIGCAQLMGIKLPENFRTPLFSTSFQQFWRRWHISLSTWLRDYIYIPLGGSRGTALTTARNILLTMLLGGLWHGANWTFVLWGGIHGSILTLEYVFRAHLVRKHNFVSAKSRVLVWLQPVIGCVWVFAVFTLTMILFRSQSMAEAIQVFGRLGSMEGLSPSSLHNRIPLLKALALTSAFLSVEFVAQLPMPQAATAWRTRARPISYACMLWAIALFGTFDGTSFVYFQF